MKKILPLSDLRPGMKVIAPDVSWLNRPFIFSGDIPALTQEQIDELDKDGYREAMVDLAQSSVSSVVSDMKDDNDVNATIKEYRNVPKVSFQDEIPNACRIHKKGIEHAKDFIQTMRKTGTLDIERSRDTIQDIMESLENNQDALLALSWLHTQDEYTFTHCVNVAILSTCFSKYIGHSESEIAIAGLSGLFHDMGKCLIPLEILNAPRKLTEQEFAVMKKHPELGYKSLKATPSLEETILLGAIQHHEKFDGSGYPYGLSGNEISTIGSAIGLADIYDALTSRRVYKLGMPPHKALGIIYTLIDKDYSAYSIGQFIRMLGVYPIGSTVVLEDNSVGIVSASNPESTLLPVVTLLLDNKHKPLLAKKIVDYRDTKRAYPKIMNCVPANDFNIDAAKVLGITAYH